MEQTRFVGPSIASAPPSKPTMLIGPTIPREPITTITPLGPQPMAEDRDVWERQPTETDAAWRAFRIFRDLMPAERSTRAVYEIATGQPVCRSQGLIQAPLPPGSRRDVATQYHKYRTEYQWDTRVTAYDRYIDTKHRAALEASRYKARVETALLGRELRMKASLALRELQAIVYVRVKQEDGTYEKEIRSALTASQIVRLAEVGTKLERLSLGLDDAGPSHGATLIGQVNIQQNLLCDEELLQRAREVISAREDNIIEVDQL